MPRTQKILVVEDSFELRVALELSLSQEGYDVRLMPDGRSFLTEFDVYQPDLAVIDLRLPNMDGVEVMRELRKRSSIPAIVFSAVDIAPEIKSALDAGATDYVLKGTGVNELLRRIRIRLPDDVATESSDSIEPQAGGSERTSKLTGTPAHKVNILVCEPDPDQRRDVGEQIRSIGHEPIVPSTDNEADLLSGKQPIDLVVLDPAMTDRLGVRMVEQISYLNRVRPLGLIFLANRVSPELRRRLKKCMVADYIDKSTQMWEIPLRVRYAVEKQRKAA